MCVLLISPHRKTSTFNLTRQTGNSTTVFRRVQSFEAQRRHRRTGMGQSHRKLTHSIRQSTQFYCSVLGCLKIQESFGETDTVLTRDLPVYPPCDGVLLTKIKLKSHCFHTTRKKACSEGARLQGKFHCMI